MLLEGIHDRFGIAEEKISEFEDTVIETMQNETKRKMSQKINEIYRESVSFRATSGALIHGLLESMNRIGRGLERYI